MIFYHPSVSYCLSCVCISWLQKARTEKCKIMYFIAWKTMHIKYGVMLLLHLLTDLPHSISNIKQAVKLKREKFLMCAIKIKNELETFNRQMHDILKNSGTKIKVSKNWDIKLMYIHYHVLSQFEAPIDVEYYLYEQRNNRYTN